MYNKIFSQKKLYLLILLFFASLFSQPVYAYAGPGVAIGAIIVFLTVILTFFASFFISIFNSIKKIFFKSKNKNKKNNVEKKKN